MHEPQEIKFNCEDGYIFIGENKTISPDPEPKERCWFCPRSLGQGRFSIIGIRPGLEICISDCTFHREAVFKHKELPPLLEFNFILSGHYLVHYDGQKKAVEYDGEHQGINYFNSAASFCRVKANTPIRSVSVKVYREFFLAYLEKETKNLPPDLKDILKLGTNSESRHISPLTPQARAAVQQIFECPLHGLYRRLFLESRALEFLSLQLQQITDTSRQFNSCPCCRLHPQDKKHTERARNYLVSNLETPPCLSDLARTAGMSHPKLNRCFKLMYGMTVFQYLRNERLNRARYMLEKEGLSVTEVAFQVGYDSLSHFSQAYKKHFGTSPSNCFRVNKECTSSFIAA